MSLGTTIIGALLIAIVGYIFVYKRKGNKSKAMGVGAAIFIVMMAIKFIWWAL